jgi:hypothetical protein
LAIDGRSLAVGQSSTVVPLYVDVLAAGIAAGSYPVFFSMPYRMIGWPVAVGMLAHAAHWWALTVWHVDIATAALVSCLIAGVLWCRYRTICGCRSLRSGSRRSSRWFAACMCSACSADWCSSRICRRRNYSPRSPQTVPSPPW